MTFLHHVPLIYNNNDGPIGFVGVSADMGIDGSDSLCSIYKKEGNVAFLKMTTRHDNTEFFSL